MILSTNSSDPSDPVYHILIDTPERKRFVSKEETLPACPQSSFSILPDVLNPSTVYQDGPPLRRVGICSLCSSLALGVMAML